MLNPTGSKIRSDEWGSGAFGASRDGGARVHRGTDFAGVAGQWVISPIHGRAIRETRPYGDGRAADRGIVIQDSRGLEVRLFYVEPIHGIMGKHVIAGQAVGRLLSLALRYPGITDHVHLEVWSAGDRVRPVVVDSFA